MITQLEQKIVTTRKAHNCFACARKFDAGAKMTSSVNVDDYIYRLYSCETCDELMLKFSVLFEDNGLYPCGCVGEVLRYDDETDTIETPEELLKYLVTNGVTSEF